jgi:tetratricopeptide (TPR) repeat protein
MVTACVLLGAGYFILSVLALDVHVRESKGTDANGQETHKMSAEVHLGNGRRVPYPPSTDAVQTTASNDEASKDDGSTDDGWHHPSDYLAAAIKAEERGDTAEGLRLVARVFASHPDTYTRAHAYMARGSLLDDRDDYDGAIKSFTAGVGLFRGWSYAEKGQYDQAITDFNAVTQVAPEEAAAYFGRASAYEGGGQYDQAMADYDTAIGLGWKYGYFGRAEIHSLRGELEAALADFQKAVESDPLDADSVLWLHIARRRLGADDREEFTRNAKELDDPVVRFYLGALTAERLHEGALAGAPWERCRAAFHIAEDHVLRQRRSVAEPYFREAIDTCPKNKPEYLAALAAIHPAAH